MFLKVETITGQSPASSATYEEATTEQL